MCLNASSVPDLKTDVKLKELTNGPLMVHRDKNIFKQTIEPLVFLKPHKVYTNYDMKADILTLKQVSILVTR